MWFPLVRHIDVNDIGPGRVTRVGQGRVNERGRGGLGGEQGQRQEGFWMQPRTFLSREISFPHRAVLALATEVKRREYDYLGRIRDSDLVACHLKWTHINLRLGVLAGMTYLLGSLLMSSRIKAFVDASLSFVAFHLFYELSEESRLQALLSSQRLLRS